MTYEERKRGERTKRKERKKGKATFPNQHTHIFAYTHFTFNNIILQGRQISALILIKLFGFIW